MQKQTRCVVRHEQLPDGTITFPGSVHPIDPSTAFHHLEGDSQPYPRYFNTANQLSVAQLIADLEQAEAGLLFSSGMAAITTTLKALLPPSSHAIFLQGLYGGTQALVAKELATWQVTHTAVERMPHDFAAAIQANTRVIYLESPTNPLLDVVDLAAIAELAQRHQIVTVIDNTFASPINQNPIPHGIDVVIHSGTKYLGGHSDLACGAVVSTQARIDQIRAKAKLYGGSLNALSVYLLDRSLKTMDVRVRQQTENAMVLAHCLDEHAQVKRVHYPGLAAHPGHEIAQRQMHGFGAMLAFELDERVDVQAFLRSLRIVRPALSLGGVESSVCVPATTSHRDVPDSVLTALGITPSVIRFSVGVEAVEDLKQDLAQAIEAASPVASFDPIPTWRSSWGATLPAQAIGPPVALTYNIRS